MLKRFSICILILALTVVFTGCGKESNIKVNAGSKFDEMFGTRPKIARTNAPSIIYLGNESQNNSGYNTSDSGNLSFEFEDLKR